MRAARSSRLLALAAALSFLSGSAYAQSQTEYSNEDARACLDCHGNPRILGIVDTVHADSHDPRTPAAQKQCQSCHGPGATHMQFPMQVENLTFGQKSKTPASVQNRICLECHEDGNRSDWKASAHGFEEVVCSTCHAMHDPASIVPAEAKVISGCTASGCHDELMQDADVNAFSHILGKPIGEMGEVTCAACHNPHGPLNSQRCLECHEFTPQVLAQQSEKAQRFHATATERGTECIRCHKGIAHPIPPLERWQNGDAPSPHP